MLSSRFSHKFFYITLVVIFCASLGVAQVGEGAVTYQAPKLIGHWSLDSIVGSGTTELSGFKRSGIVVSSPSATTSSLGGGLQFDGVDDYIELPLDLSWDENNKISISFWVKPSTVSNNLRLGLLGKLGSGWEWSIHQYNSSLNFVYWDSTGNHTNGMDAGWGNVLDVSRWTHIVYVWDSQKSYFYADGVLVNTKVATNPVINQDRTNKLALGGNVDTYAAGVRYWPGALDDVRIYDKALSAGEVKNLYQSNNLSACKIGVTPLRNYNTGLVGHWTFDGKNLTTATATDSSGFGNHGTLVSGPRPTIGKLGQALNFDGVDDSVSVPHNSSLNYTDAFTLASWVYYSGGNSYPRLIDKYPAPSIYFAAYNGAIGWYGYINGINRDFRFDENIRMPINQWSHLVVTYHKDVPGPSVYINGEWKVSASYTGTLSTTFGNLLLGNSPTLPRHLKGSLDDVRIYNRALSAQEIKDLYNATKGSKIKAP